MEIEPTHESYDAVVRDARASDSRLGQVILRAGTELPVYQVWDEFKLAGDTFLFDIREGNPPRFVPAPIARNPLSSIEPVLSESARELVDAFKMQSQYSLELIKEQEANSFSFVHDEQSRSDLLLFGPEDAREPLEDWIREFIFDRVHHHLDHDDFVSAYELLAPFQGEASPMA